MRIALVAGTLGKGGAEKQLVYMARALKASGADVRVYCATRGEFYEPALREIGIDPIWFGRYSNPVARLATLAKLLRGFRPHVIQSAHFYTNLYVSLLAKVSSSLCFGSLRNDAVSEVRYNRRWGKRLIKSPPALIANSHSARKNAAGFGVAPDRVYVLPNVIDLEQFDAAVPGEEPSGQAKHENLGRTPTAVVVCRLVPAKRLDRFIRALEVVNQSTKVRGVIVGEGRKRQELEDLARERGFDSQSLQFSGWRNDVPSLLREADMYVSCSDHEGFPNSLLEAMAAEVPAVGTPAGDVAEVITDGVTGYVVPFDDENVLAERMERLAGDAALRRRMGKAARQRVEQTYSPDSLADRLLEIYRAEFVAKGGRSAEQLLTL